MELIDLIMLSAASLFPYYSAHNETDKAREKAVKQAKLIWKEVLKQKHED